MAEFNITIGEESFNLIDLLESDRDLSKEFDDKLLISRDRKSIVQYNSDYSDFFLFAGKPYDENMEIFDVIHFNFPCVDEIRVEVPVVDGKAVITKEQFDLLKKEFES